MTSADALLMVDVQRDFCPGGALPVPSGDEVVSCLNDWIDHALRARALVLASGDLHPRDHVSFTERGGPWPPHCVQGSQGAEFHPDLHLPENAIRIWKGQDSERDALSAFDRTGLSALLRGRSVRALFVGGLAQEVCVRATVLDALREGFETHVIVPGTRPLDARNAGAVLRELEALGAVLEPDDRVSTQRAP
jgi:nicotinamidase/pyrazinamidase